MTAKQIHAIRKRLGLTAYEWGRALGYDGARAGVQVTISRLESGARDIPPAVARLAEMYGRHGMPHDLISPPANAAPAH